MKELKELIVQVKVNVDVDRLITAYTGGIEIDKEDLPSLENIIEHELGWLEASGILVNQIVVQEDV